MNRHFIFAAFLGLSILAGEAAQTGVPTPRKPMVDNYFGITVTDDYRWLEDAAAPEVREWTARQNAQSRHYFDQSPVRAALARDLEALYKKSSGSYSGLQRRSNTVFALRLLPPAQQPVLLALPSVTDLKSQCVVVDPNARDRSGATAIDWYSPSRDGSQVAVCLSRNGSEAGTLHFFVTATGQELSDEVPRAQFPTAGGSAAWAADGSGVFYTRYPAKGERPDEDLNFYQQIWFHKLGTPTSEDTYQLGREFPRIAEIALTASEDGRYILASVANGDGGDYAHWLRGPAGQWRQITQFEDGIKSAEFGRDGALYLLSRLHKPRGEILRMPVEGDLAQAKRFVKEGKEVIEAITPASGGVYVHDLVGGPSQVRFFDLSGKLRARVPVAPISAVGEMVALSGDALLFRNVSYLKPFAYYVFDPAKKTVEPTALAGTSPVDFSDVEVVREMATSRDGTQVPMNIIRRKGTRLDGTNPTLLYGYGGYGVNQTPNFDFTRRLWLDAGGVLVIANLRGGGEFGEAWHTGGNLTRKQNVFDDFIGCAQRLIAQRYTTPAKLAIEGGSNGGLLMGAVLTQRPELFRAVASHVGIYDMLRVELEPNGAFNVTEFGTVKNRAQFDALYAYSPLHHVKDGVAYPAVLLTTGDNDGRVNPYNSRKMAARLQAATSSDRPILLRTSASSGHGIGSSMKDRIAEKSDVLFFLMDQIGADQSKWK